MTNRDDAFRASIAAAAASDDARDGDAEKVERMAVAICVATGLRWADQANALTSGSGGHEEQDGYRDQARAALAALREMEGE